jgi:hypothetical protein
MNFGNLEANGYNLEIFGFAHHSYQSCVSFSRRSEKVTIQDLSTLRHVHLQVHLTHSIYWAYFGFVMFV